MDKRIRKNELCIIGLPRCDFVFSSTRSCFIAYGFQASALEVEVVSTLLRERGIEPVEAGGRLAPGQHAFCAKICSKIITSQFCIVIANNDEQRNQEVPNANVHMEYGLMLGFNKYVIPFQLESQQLPFNVASLDTIKYNPKTFKERAAAAIDQAIRETTQEASVPEIDQLLDGFILSKGLLMVPLTTEGDRNLFDLGRPLGYNLLMDFSGLRYTYMGKFTNLRPEVVIWRLKTLERIVSERFGSFDKRVAAGLVAANLVQAAKDFEQNLKIWLIVTGKQDKEAVVKALASRPLKYPSEVYSREDIEEEMLKLTKDEATPHV